MKWNEKFIFKYACNKCVNVDEDLEQKQLLVF